MDKINHRAYLVLIARLVLSGAFLMAALPKIQDPVAFATSIGGFRVIDGQLSAWVAVALPWLELVIGFGLLVPYMRRSSGIIIGLLLVIFIVLHASAWARGLDISCGCFGESETKTAPNYLWLLLRNIGLLVACVCVLVRDWSRPLDRKT